MTLEYHFVNFYDSGFDNQNESSICDDNQDLLNVAFLDSPENSISNLDNSSYSGKDNQNWISNRKRKLMPRYGELYTEIENLKSSETYETSEASKRDEGNTECIFTSTCLDEFPKSSEVYDRSKSEKKSNEGSESEKIEPKIPVPVYDDSRFYYVPHELSTILEVDSLLMDGSVESTMNSDKCSNFLMNDLKNIKSLETEDSLRNLKKTKCPNFSANVMKVIQNSHIEKLLQEPGVLEESDLTLISPSFDITCNTSEKSTDNGYGRSYNKVKSFSDVKSASLISFLQHELSCMKDCVDE